MKRIALTLMLTALIAFGLAACGGAGGTTNYPGTKDGAKALLQDFMKPGADAKKLTMNLRPTKEDYRAFYADESIAARAEAYYDKMWSSGSAAIAPKEGQTDLRLFSATTEDLRDSKGEYAEFPSGMVTLAGTNNLKPNLTMYAFKFVKPGENDRDGVRGLNLC